MKIKNPNNLDYSFKSDIHILGKNHPEFVFSKSKLYNQSHDIAVYKRKDLCFRTAYILQRRQKELN